MIRLDSGTKVLQLIATSTADVTVSGLGVTTAVAPGFSQETAATATTQTICSAPSASEVKQIDRIFIKNGGSSNTLTLQTYNSTGPATTIHGYVVLAANESYEWTHAKGGVTKDASGVEKTSVTFAGLVVAFGKTLTVSNSLTFSGTDGSTLNVGTGGTLGTAAYTASTAYDVAGAAAAVTPTTLGLVIGTNVQAYDADLTTWAGITPGTGVAAALGTAVTGSGAIMLAASPTTTGTLTAGIITASGSIASALGGSSTAFIADATSSRLQLFQSGVELWNIELPNATGGVNLNLSGVGIITRTTSTGLAVTGTLSSTGILSTTDATDATSATAASLKTAGGIAAVKGLWIGGASRLVGNVQMDGTLLAIGNMSTNGTLSGANLLCGDGISAFKNTTGSIAFRAGVGVNIGGTAGAGIEFYYTTATNTSTFSSYDRTAGAAKILEFHASQLKLSSGVGAFAAGDKYLIVDASGNVHISALGPAS